MKTFQRNLLAYCAALAAGSMVFAADSKPADKQTYEERYKVLWEQDMFMKDRRRKDVQQTRAGGGGTDPRYAPRAIETLFALRGVVLEEGQYRAYFEDMTNAKMLRLNVGDSIAKGHIAEIDIDAIAYDAGGQITWVNVGTDLRGKAAVLLTSSEPPRASPTTTTTTTTTTTPAVTADGSGGTAADTGTGAATTGADPATLSAEERMRQRRLQGK